MITFESVRKTFPDGTTAVDSLDLEIREGEVAVLVGPSGCGKTTTLRMINRMVEPSGGNLLVDGRDVMTVDPPQLRRGIGYVIQQIGLFPHRTIAQNIATVPGLVGWDRRRIAERVDELMITVGLDESVAERYPHQLSGGQRQRVGVARALAVDPPIMLMDEPFGAVDPIVRTKLQDEFLRLQSEVRKTIAFVTHDIDEAIKMGDRIALFSEGGRLEQYDTPANILADPANDFVESFLGSERGLKRLALIPASSVQAQPGPIVSPADSLAEAAAAARRCGTDWVVVVDGAGCVAGWIGADELDGEGTVDALEPRAFRVLVRAEDSLRAALNAMVISRTGVAVRVSGERRYEGLLTREVLTGELQR